MTITIKCYQKGENTLVIERCMPGNWCSNLKTFLEHIGRRSNGINGLDYAQMESNGVLSMALVYRMPRKLGNFVKIYFCPFCGGQVSELSKYTNKKTGKVLENTLFQTTDIFDRESDKYKDEDDD